VNPENGGLRRIAASRGAYEIIIIINIASAPTGNTVYAKGRFGGVPSWGQPDRICGMNQVRPD